MPNKDIKYPKKLTLENLVPSVNDTISLKSIGKTQRLALYNLCTILLLTFYDKDMRAAAETLREMIRQNTLDEKVNKCEFDMTEAEKKRIQSPIITSSQKNADT